MRKSWLLVASGLFAFLAVGGFWLWLFIPRHRITLANLHRIEAGMTQREVEEVLGCPPGNHSYAGWAEYFGHGQDQLKLGPEWVGDQIAIQILLDNNGLVRQKLLGIVEYPTWCPGRLRNEFRLWWGLEPRMQW